MKTENIINGVNISFLAIDQWVQDNVIKPIETDVKGKDFITWGKNNDYPEYLFNLYSNAPTLKTVIEGVVDYVCGDDIVDNTRNGMAINRKGHTIKDIVKWVAKDLVIYGGFAINVVLNKQMTSPAELYYIDFKRVRSNKDHSKLYYASDWGKSYGRVKYIEYPNFNEFQYEEEHKGNYIFYYENDINKVYPSPMYSASVNACEIEKLISQYHLNNLHNNFAGSYIVNFNSGKPTDEQKEEIEDEFYDKFTGVENAGRPMLCFNNSKVNETTITKVESDNYKEKYDSLVERSSKEIFTAFRMSPILCGIDYNSHGFNATEYAQVYKLFYKTVIMPMQNTIKDEFNKIFNTSNAIDIIPFEINFETDDDSV